jgi:hypothetical protein
MVELSNISIKSLLIVLLLTAGIFSISTKLLSSNLTYAQTSSTSSSSSTGTGDLKKTTSAGALDILLQISPQPIGHTDPTSFKIKFMTKGTDTVQPHIDYDVIINDSNGKQVFQASELAGQQGKPLHTAEGTVTIPYTFQSAGDYSIHVTIYGILFSPIKPESADFTIKVA